MHFLVKVRIVILTTVRKLVGSGERSKELGDVAFLAGWNWGWWGDNWWVGRLSCSGCTLGSIAFLSNSALVVSTEDFDVSICTPVGTPRISHQPKVHFRCSISSVSNNKDGMVGWLGGATVEHTISIVSKSGVTGIDASNSSTICSNQCLQLVLGARVISQWSCNISTTVVDGFASRAGELGVCVKIWIVSLVKTLTFESCGKEGSIGGRISTLTSIHVTKKCYYMVYQNFRIIDQIYETVKGLLKGKKYCFTFYTHRCILTCLDCIHNQ
jgi:hypothetical protein